MSTITVEELTRNPAGLIDRVAAGEHVIVERDGQPVAELRPVAVSPATPRPYGLAAGEFSVPDDFDAPLPEEILRAFKGE